MVSERVAKYNFTELCNRDVLLPKAKGLGCTDVFSYFSYVNGSSDANIVDIDSDAEDDFDPQEWIVQRPHIPQKKASYSSFCAYSFGCKEGSKCGHKHTDAEKKFFEKHNGVGQQGS
jgi:hypothetical protein